MNVGVVIYERVEELDFAGPFEVFANIPAGENRVYVFTVAKQMAQVTCDGGLRVVPNHTFVECPPLEVLVVPGGPGRTAAMNDEAILDFVKARASGCSYVLSVCTGAFILARAGLLAGKSATTHHAAFQELADSALVGEAVRGRFVVDGQIISTAGVTSGIDGALEVVKRWIGTNAYSQMSEVMEYEQRV